MSSTPSAMLSGQQQNEVLQDFTDASSDLPWNYKDKNEPMERNRRVDDENLSQQMQQLSTDVVNINNSLPNEIKTKLETIPNYLTKRHKPFIQILHQILSTMKIGTAASNMDDLRKTAISMYKITIIQIYQLLWTTYFKSGTGQLIHQSTQNESITYPTNVSIWPNEIRAMLQAIETVKNTNVNHEAYLEFMNSHLHELDNHLKKSQLELNDKIKCFQGYTLTIHTHIGTYLEQHLHSFRMEIEHKIELVHYDYHIHALDLEYCRLNPNIHQKKLMKSLCESKYEQETVEQEHNLLKQKIDYYNSPSQSFEHSSIAQSKLIESIQNAEIRQHLYNQYRDTALQARASLFQLYLTTAEDEKQEFQKKYEENMKQLQSDERFINGNADFSSILFQIIHERCEKISERIRCVYKFKAQSVLHKTT
ncbi:unnamed protein product [Adineta ricciae]|uniref:Uncharacterized protein n=1 Tax=Adineta ricciae TaxID=249248 RepID=A0A814TQ32_ADIRI|nr:unnamed protein product [Adineta ricciae]CAF1511561.1 unnamed protein product [Adineta ricciae]